MEDGHMIVAYQPETRPAQMVVNLDQGGATVFGRSCYHD